MNKEAILNLAITFLQKRGIEFVGPGELGRLNGYNQEVIFLDPLVLEQNVAVVDPGDIRVWVNTNTEHVSLADHM